MELPELLTSHETRLQRVEEASREVAVKIGEYGVKIDNLGTQLQNGFHEISTQTKAIGEAVGKHLPRIEALEDLEQRRRKRVRGLKKFIVPLLIAGAGAVSTKLGTVVVDWFSR